jgi:hypothetical protein
MTAPAGWYPVEDDPRLRYWDGTQWTNRFQEHGQPELQGQPETTGSRIKAATATAAGRLTSKSAFPEGTKWSAVGKPLTGIGAGRFHMDGRYLYFERGTLRTDSQQVPISAVLDVDVVQTMAQKARGVYTVRVHIQRTTGIEIVTMDDIPDGREAQRFINETAHAARLAIQQAQNTRRFEGTAPQMTASSSPTPVAAPQEDLIAQISKLAELKAAGALTEEEFTAAKAKLLG